MTEQMKSISLRLPKSVIDQLDQDRGDTSLSSYVRSLVTTALERDAVLLGLLSAELDYSRTLVTSQIENLLRLILQNVRNLTPEELDAAVAYVTRPDGE